MDAPVLPGLLNQIPAYEQISSVTADGAYDTRNCHDAVADRGAHTHRQGKGPPDPFRAFLTPALQECQTLEDRHRRRGRTKRSIAGIEIPGSCPLATMERLPPPKPRRNEDALCETAGAAPHGTGLRPTGHGASGPHRRSERLHCARHPCHRAGGISLSGKGEPRPLANLCNRAPRNHQPQLRCGRRAMILAAGPAGAQIGL